MPAIKSERIEQVRRPTMHYICDGCGIQGQAERPASVAGWYAAMPLSSIIDQDPADTTAYFCRRCWGK